MGGCTRREFNALLIGTTAAGLFGGCTNMTTTPVAPSGKQVFLAFAQFPALAAAGGAAIVDVDGQFPIAVVRTTDAAAVALSATCTHQGCLVDYEPSVTHLHCPCHGAEFTLEGAVIGGPTTVPLPSYAATVQPDGINVDLT